MKLKYKLNYILIDSLVKFKLRKLRRTLHYHYPLLYIGSNNKIKINPQKKKKSTKSNLDIY